MKTITSLQNTRIKELLKFKKAANRKKDDFIIIEGSAEIRMANEAGILITEVFYCDEFARDKKLLDKFNDQIVTELLPEIFLKVSFREKPDGFLALAKPERKKINEISLSKYPLIIVLETVEKPGNLGAILRSADAAGADAVILCNPRTDIFNPNVIRASLGTVFIKQVVACSNEEALDWLHKNKICSFSASVQSDNIYTKADYKNASAIIIGTEHEGLSKFWQENSDEKVKIPMKGKIDSLNASVSAAIILYEAVRQRNN